MRSKVLFRRKLFNFSSGESTRRGTEAKEQLVKSASVPGESVRLSSSITFEHYSIDCDVNF